MNMNTKVACISTDTSLASHLNAIDGFELDVGSPQEARPLLHKTHHDVVVLDIRNHHAALSLIEAIRRWQPGVRILLLVDDNSDEQTLMQLIFAGALGYLNQADIPSRLHTAVLAIQQNQAWVPRHIVSHFINALSTLKQHTALR